MFNCLKRKHTVTEALLNKIEECKSRAPKSTKQLASKMFGDLANAVQNQWTKQHLKNYAAHIAQGETHEKFIYNHIMKACSDALQSGKAHASRGVLGDEGLQHLELFNHAIDRMISLGCYTQEWAEENLRTPVLRKITETG